MWDRKNSQNFLPITTQYHTSDYVAANNQPNQEWNGYDFVTSQDPETPPSPPVFAYGLYKVTFEKEVLDEFIPLPNFFYLDYRDTRIPTYGNIDIWIKYDYQNQSVKITQRNDLIGNGDDGPHWISIQNGTYIPIWEFQQQGAPSTGEFENYETHCNTYLEVNAEYNSENNLVPSLRWGTVPNFTTTGYKIYRSIRPQGMLPGTFSLLATVSSSTHTYLDETVLVKGNQVAYYKVRAYNNTTESGYTTTESISISGFYKRENIEDVKSFFPFVLDQNYPNPFNPSTNIRYYLSESRHVKIVVTNMLGQDVATLIDALQNEGEHSVTFNATGLPSGVYFYRIQTKDFTEIKKMMYLR